MFSCVIKVFSPLISGSRDTWLNNIKCMFIASTFSRLSVQSASCRLLTAVLLMALPDASALPGGRRRLFDAFSSMRPASRCPLCLLPLCLRHPGPACLYLQIIPPLTCLNCTDPLLGIVLSSASVASSLSPAGVRWGFGVPPLCHVRPGP